MLQNQGGGTFADQVTYTVGHRPLFVATGDLDRDGDLDLAVANSEDSNVAVLMGLNLFRAVHLPLILYEQ